MEPPCTATLLVQKSKSKCTLGTSFGCWRDDPAKLWASGGCRGVFSLRGELLECSGAGLHGGLHGGRSFVAAPNCTLPSMLQLWEAGPAPRRTTGRRRSRRYAAAQPPAHERPTLDIVQMDTRPLAPDAVHTKAAALNWAYAQRHPGVRFLRVWIKQSVDCASGSLELASRTPQAVQAK